MVKNNEELIGRYLTGQGSWHNSVKNFLNNTKGDYLEIGVYHGKFLAEIAIQFPEKKIIGIDPFVADGHTGEPKDTILYNVEFICNKNIENLDNIYLHKCTTEDFLKFNKFDSIKNVSCILIDGSHNYNDILFDIQLISKIINNHNKLIIFDDTNIPDVKQAIDYFKIKYKENIISEKYGSEHEFIIK